MNAISFELATKLQDLGVKKECFTLDEILEMLPANIMTQTPCGKPGVVSYVLTLIKSNFYCISYDCMGGCEECPCKSELELITFSNKNPAEPAGELLAWCIENGHVKPSDIRG